MIESGGEKNGRGICLAMPGVGAGERRITPCHAWRWYRREMDYYLPCMALVHGRDGLLLAMHGVGAGEMDYSLPLVRLLIR